MDVDEFLEQVGSFGPFQKKLIAWMYLASVFSGLPVQQDVFIAYTPSYRCFIPGCDSPSSSSYYEDFLNFTTPYDGEQWESCDRFAPLNSTSVDEDLDVCRKTSFSSSSTLGCSEGYVYDTQVFSSSAVVDFELTCSKDSLPSLLGSMFMVGSLVSAVVMGFVGDIFGRKGGLLASVVILASGGLVVASSPSFWVLVLGRFITSIGCNGVYQMAYIMSVEYVLPAHRVGVGIMINAPYALGGMVVATLAYFIRDNWRLLTFLYTGPAVILLLGYWVIQESVRWQIAKKKYVAAEATIRYISMKNGVPARDFHNKLADAELSDVIEKKNNATDMFKLPNIRKRCLIQFFIWPCVVLAYYGVSLNSVNIGNTIFLNFILAMIVELPGHFLAWASLDRIGRKGTVFLSCVFSGFMCFLSGLISTDHSAVIVGLSLVGKFGATVAISTIFVYACEIFPTEYRNVGVGMCSMFGRAGGILAPVIASLGRTVHQSIPLLIIGLLSVTSGILCLFLPETAGTALPTTLQQSEEFGRDQSPFDFVCGRKKATCDDSYKDIDGSN